MEILIFANGERCQSDKVNQLIDHADYIIAADGGANYCSDLAITPDLLVGDLDSIKPELIRSYEDSGVDIQRHHPHKDATDLELALEQALRYGAKHVWLIGALGKRWDMSLANIMLTAADKYSICKISLVGRDCYMYILHPGRSHTINGCPGQTVSLVPLQDGVKGVTLTGFEYPLSNHTIPFGSSLGVSNVVESNKACIQHTEGILLCIEETHHLNE